MTAYADVAPEDAGACCVTHFVMADGTVRQLSSIADQLYLMPDGAVRPASALAPGERMQQADGGVAVMRHVEAGSIRGGVRSFALGDFDAEDGSVDGHLLNAYGMVIADVAVQLSYYRREGSRP
ncbi:hypothetical protein [Bradyrhizobium sp. SBR1B]|uniref:hypothetical protein n=1 Tax=Bradyrhizobium sp. SBR1B TaxID=2663836 RepID=UPI001606F12E|nr:hypothetical protein [Bradyrhizobium sp. SBR1B]MBB4383316.1 hypothetical protein [Bradyrhizobium sp. SBR1B]